MYKFKNISTSLIDCIKNLSSLTPQWNSLDKDIAEHHLPDLENPDFGLGIKDMSFTKTEIQPFLSKLHKFTQIYLPQNQVGQCKI